MTEETNETTKKQIAQIVDQGIRHEGHEIVLPDNPYLTYEQGAQALMDRADEEAATVNVHETIEGSPWDALVALRAVLAEVFGWATTKGKTVQTLFGSMEQKPQVIDIRTGPGPSDVMQVPVGEMSAPGLGFSFNVSPEPTGIHLTAQAPKHKAPALADLAARVREYMQTNSIYRGKSFKMPECPGNQPEFIDWSHARPEELVLTNETRAAVETELFTPVRKLKHLEALDIPIRRTVVLSGRYGTGKSFTMACLGREAEVNGWTYILVEDPHQLADAITYAQQYQPAIIAVEDIDRVTGERTEKANELFNTLSGVLSGRAAVMAVATTNFPERIDPAMLRPGRIDSLIEVTPPDAESVESLLFLYGRGTLAVNGSLSKVSKKLAGQIPATIREVVERAKLGMVRRGDSKVTEEDLVVAANSMGKHLELLDRKEEEEMPTLDKVLRAAVTASVGRLLSEYGQRIYDQDHEEAGYAMAEEAESAESTL